MPRTARAQQTRDATSRKAAKRAMPQTADQSILFIPPEIIPADKVYRWIRISTLNQPDHDNWAKRVRAGWTPVPRGRHPDTFPTMPIPGLENAGQADVIVIGNGLILCERPKKAHQAERERLRQENAETIRSIKWTGQDTGTFGGHAPTTDESEVAIEQVVGEGGGQDAVFKE